MKTKIVYVLSSDDNDMLLSQLFMSSFSLKKHNPKAYTVLVVDHRTNSSFVMERKNALNYIDEIITVQAPDDLNKKATSRWIKTSLRKYIKGEFFFLDIDTVVTGKLEGIDSLQTDIAAVLDRHVTLERNVVYEKILKEGSLLNWKITEKDYNYFNSGVMFVRETTFTHEFYTLWHKNWEISHNLGQDIDQPALGLTNQQKGYVIKELPGIWNCQIMGNGLRFLSNAIILHYFNSNIGNKTNSYAFTLSEPRICQVIRDNNYVINEELIKQIYDAKSQFCDLTEILAGNQLLCYRGVIIQTIYDLYHFHPQLYVYMMKFGKLLNQFRSK